MPPPARIRLFIARKDWSWKTRSVTLWPEGPLAQPRGSGGPAETRRGSAASPPSAQNHRLQPRAVQSEDPPSSPPPSTYPARGSLHWQVAGEAEREKIRRGFHSPWCHRAHPSRASRAFSPRSEPPFSFQHPGKAVGCSSPPTLQIDAQRRVVTVPRTHSRLGSQALAFTPSRFGASGALDGVACQSPSPPLSPSPCHSVLPAYLWVPRPPHLPGPPWRPQPAEPGRPVLRTGPAAPWRCCPPGQQGEG